MESIKDDPILIATKRMHRWWRFVVLSIILMAILGIAFFAILVGYYRWQIENGESERLARRFNNNLLLQSIPETIKSIKKRELESKTAMFLGNPKPEITIVEFIDFQCPFCKKSVPIIKKVAENYGYKVKIITRHFPVESVHPGTTKLSILAYCAGEQNRFWEMHDLLFENQDSLSGELVNSDVKFLSDQAFVDYNKISACISNPDSLTKVNADYSIGIKYGVRGTPTFFIDGEKVVGVISYEDWQKFFDSLEK